jgi:hypothetical protein
MCEGMKVSRRNACGFLLPPPPPPPLLSCGYCSSGGMLQKLPVACADLLPATYPGFPSLASSRSQPGEEEGPGSQVHRQAAAAAAAGRVSAVPVPTPGAGLPSTASNRADKLDQAAQEVTDAEEAVKTTKAQFEKISVLIRKEWKRFDMSRVSRCSRVICSLLLPTGLSGSCAGQ